jgi:beta-galactosidase/beta-glucuronidase
MKRYFVLIISLLIWCIMTAGNIDISGKWGVKLDRHHAGEREGWINNTFSDSITLPGALHAQGFGDDVTAQTKWYSGSLSVLWQTHPMYEKYRKPGNIKIFDFLQPAKHYIGVAWYKRNFEMSDYSSQKEYILCLERVHWESTLYINQKKAGANLGLGTSHEYNISGYLKPGKNEIAVRVDNSHVVDVGRIPHSMSEQTMAAWNGVLGDMKILSKDKIWIDDVQIFPDFEKKQAVVKLKVANRLNKSEKIQLNLKARNYNSKRTFHEKELRVTQRISSDSITAIEIIYPFSKKVQSWD